MWRGRIGLLCENLNLIWKKNKRFNEMPYYALRITAGYRLLRLSAIGIQARPFAFARLSREQTLTQVCFAIALRIECGGGGGSGSGAIVATSLALVHQHAP